MTGCEKVANNEAALQAAVADRPLSVGFGVTRSFQSYRSVSWNSDREGGHNEAEQAEAWLEGKSVPLCV